ncbi:MAG: TldD/PmbA family protein [Marinifilaceae bacterium]
MKKQAYLMLLLCFLSTYQVSAQEPLLELLREELNTQYAELKTNSPQPYYMDYRVIDKQVSYVSTTFGVEKERNYYHHRRFVPQLRIGSVLFDNFRTSDMGSQISAYGASTALLPLQYVGRGEGIRQAMWNETEKRYRFALKAYEQSKVQQQVSVQQEDKAPFFSVVEKEKHYEQPLSVAEQRLNIDEWSNRMKQISAVFNDYPELSHGEAMIDYNVERRYFINTDGTEVVQNQTYARITVNGLIKADDGMELPLTLSYFAYKPENLPSVESIKADAVQMSKTLLALKQAPVADPYSGPALLSGAASGVFFHEIFGHRIEGQRMKRESDGQTFKKMMDQYVLPPALQVFDDPTISKYNGEDLNGYYKFDDQGVRASRVDVVVDGKLHDFLMTRMPIDNHPKSNGHARSEGGFDPVSRQSNLVIETKEHKSQDELRELLVAEVKNQGKEYGYFFKEVTGGLTFTGKSGTNSFNVNPLEVYRVYADGRGDELVRGVTLIGTPLAMFSNIVCAGGDSQVFTGMCGAESGFVPVTAISPMILVQTVETQRSNKSQAPPPILARPEMR